MRCFLFGGLLLGVLAGASGPAVSADVVRFDSAGAPPSLAALSRAQDNEETIEEASGQPIWGHLYKPDGEGPYPAVVMLHGCVGLRQTNAEWAQWFTDQGYVALLVDSLGPRSKFNVCRDMTGDISPADFALDAEGARRHLTQQLFVDPERIVLAGWSYGAIAALAATRKDGPLATLNKSFKGMVGFYPYCLGSERLTIPSLILIGDKDTWTPASRCTLMRDRAFNQTSPIDVLIFKGAYHGFDIPELGTGFETRGADGKAHWLEYNSAAHATSKREVGEFLEVLFSR